MLNALLIFSMQLVIVPLSTLRTTFVVKGLRLYAALVGLVESLIYVIALGIIFSDLSNISNMIAYAVGYAVGVLIGTGIERKLAIGYRQVSVNLLKEDDDLVDLLRSLGYGVTVFIGEGMNNEKRYRLDMMVKRSLEKDLLKLLQEQAPKAFILTFEPLSYKGGFVKNKKKKDVQVIKPLQEHVVIDTTLDDPEPPKTKED